MRSILRDSTRVLQPLQEKLEARNETLVLQAKPRSEPFGLRPCEMMHIMVENIGNKPQPINLKFNEIKGEPLIMLSLSH